MRGKGWAAAWLGLVGLVTFTGLATAEARRFEPFPGFYAFSVETPRPEGAGVQASDIAAGPDGTVYLVQAQAHRVQRWSGDGRLLGSWGSYGGEDGRFNNPILITVAAAGPTAGQVYVLEAASGRLRLQRFDAAGRFLGRTSFFAFGRFRVNPQDLAVGPDGSAYVLLGDRDHIWRVGLDDTVAEVGPPALQSPTVSRSTLQRLVVGNDGLIYASVLPATGRQIPAIHVIGAGRRIIRSFGRPDEAEPLRPVDIALAEDGNLWVLEADGHRVRRVSPTGTVLGTHPLGALNAAPERLAATPSGRLFVTSGGQFGTLDAAGSWQGPWGSPAAR